MSTDNGSGNKWRYHKVPTFADAEDAMIAGMSGKQLVGIVLALVTGYGVFLILGALPMMPRLMICALVATVVAGMIAIRPGGRSLFMYLMDWVFLYLGPRYYGDQIGKLVSGAAIDDNDRRRGKGGIQMVVRVPLPGRSFWVNVFFRVPFKRARGRVQIGAVVLAACLGFALSGTIACSSDIARAQVPQEYAGKRVYVQAVVANLEQNINTGGQSVSVELKAAAPLRWAGPRVNETLQSVYELNANRTRVSPGWTRVGGTREVESIEALQTGEEFGFEHIFLGDLHELRPYCDVSTGVDGYYINPDLAPPKRTRRIHSKDCRIRPPKYDGPDWLSVDEALSKPTLTVNWEDRKQNQGARSIGRSMLPFPGPSMEKISFELTDTGGAELLNIDRLCKVNDTNVVSMGVQSAQPDTPTSVSDYFDGQGGRRIAGEVKTCPLEISASKIARVVLPETIVFAAGNSDFEIKVRPLVETFRPEDVVNSAKLTIFDSAGAAIYSKAVPKAGDGDFDPLKPDTVKFNIAPPYYEYKVFSTDLDTAVIQIQIDIEHAVTVVRPVYQPIAFYPEKMVSHITSCGCSKSGGSCNNGGSCSCSSRSSSAWFTYWEDHHRVDAMDREYLPDDPSGEVTLVFSQTLLFEPLAVTFDQPYTDFIYVEPTPEPGEVRENPYVGDGERIGLWDGEPLLCGPGVAEDDEGRFTGWLWVAPGVSSEGLAYGGCRRAYACKLDIPVAEEPFGPGGTPTEEDYECINR